MLPFFSLIEKLMNSYDCPSQTSHNNGLPFLSMCLCISEPVWEIVLCRGLISHSAGECVCVYL